MNWIVTLHKKLPQAPSWTGLVPGIADATIESVADILDEKGGVDFERLIRFFEQASPGDICSFFEKPEHVRYVLFPFLDFLKNSYFSQKKIIPKKVMRSFQHDLPIRSEVFSYIKKRNLPILSIQSDEQYDIIAFHFFLLGIRQDFDLAQDIQHRHLQGIKGLLLTAILGVSRTLGSKNICNYDDIPEGITTELRHVLRIAETMNVLALVHSGNFEERSISIHLDSIIRTNIDVLLENLGSEFSKNNPLWQKLNNLCGQVQVNFWHAVPINGKTVAEVREQVGSGVGNLREWLGRQSEACFWWAADEQECLAEMGKLKNLMKERKMDEKEYLAEMVKYEAFLNRWEKGRGQDCIMIEEANEALLELVGLEKIQEIQGHISWEDERNKTGHIRKLIDTYNYATGGSFSDIEEIFEDIYATGIKNAFQIEALYYLILHSTYIKEASLEKIMYFFLNNGKQINNYFHEEEGIKITTQIIRRLHSSVERLKFLPLIEEIRVSLQKRNISQSVLSYSKVYLALALYYIECDGGENTEHAKECFFYYKNLDTSDIWVYRNPKNLRDEKVFYEVLWGMDEMERYGKRLHAAEDLQKGGEYVFKKAMEHYQQLSILSIKEWAEKIIGSMNDGEDVYTQEQINERFGRKITEAIFFNLCTTTIIGDCRNCSHPDSSECGIAQMDSEDRTETCPLASRKRGFEKKHIALPGGVFIIFVYPAVSERVFERIFLQQETHMREGFKNLFALNDKNTRLRKSKEELEKIAFYDTETWLPNKNRLNRDLFRKEKTVALIEVAGYDSIVATQWGKDDWIEIMKKVAAYFHAKSGATVYRYNETAFCLVYDTEKISEILTLLGDTMEYFLEALLANFHIDYGKNLQFHTGAIVSQGEEHLKYAHIALVKAKTARWKRIHFFEHGDERVPEETRYYTDILMQALDVENDSVKIVPYYQRIYDPKNPHAEKFEALARIERYMENGEKEVIMPAKFIDIATHKRWLPDLTLAMLRQIGPDMKKYPDLQISVNLHEQDWNDNRIMIALRAATMGNGISPDRVSIEILEEVPFDRAEDVRKIQELKDFWFRVSIDDYGQDRSNLKKIMLIRPHNIKIDRVIVENLYKEETRSDAIAAIESVVTHAKKIGATVTAEYIETEEIFRILQNLGVDFFQGFYFAKPMPIREIKKEV